MRKKIFISLVLKEKKKKETSKLLKPRFSKIRFLFQITCTNKFFATINQTILRITAMIFLEYFLFKIYLNNIFYNLFLILTCQNI